VGDGWFEYAAKVEMPRMKSNLRTHAASWYEKAAPAATGLAKEKIEHRLEAVHAADQRAYSGPPLPALDDFTAVNEKTKKSNWSAENGWCNPGTLNFVAAAGEGVTLAQIGCAAGTKDKTAITRVADANLAKTVALVFDVNSMLTKDVQIALLFRTKDGKGYETRGSVAHPGWNRNLRFRLDARDLKSSVSKIPWLAYDTAFEPRNRIDRLSILVYNGTEAGKLQVGPVRIQE
jgi:hypothetical protein